MPLPFLTADAPESLLLILADSVQHSGTLNRPVLNPGERKCRISPGTAVPGCQGGVFRSKQCYVLAEAYHRCYQCPPGVSPSYSQS